MKSKEEIQAEIDRLKECLTTGETISDALQRTFVLEGLNRQIAVLEWTLMKTPFKMPRKWFRWGKL